MAENNKKKNPQSIMFEEPPVKAPVQSNELTQEDRQYLISIGENPDEYVLGDPAMAQPDEAIYDEIDPTQITRELGASQRLKYAGLSKDEDRLRELEKDFGDVATWGDGNYVMRDPDSGELMVYNREGWMPSWADVVDAAPDIGGTIASIPSTVVGGAVGSAAGPVGTFAGGAAAGAAGYAGGAEATRRGLNWLFDVEDTRTLGETGKDVAGDAGLALAGAGVGAAAGKAIGAAGRGVGNIVKRAVIGSADDAGAAAGRLASFTDAGITPTPGMIAGPKMATRELNGASTKPWLKEKIYDVPQQIQRNWESAVSDVSQGRGGLSRAETGGVIRDNVDTLKSNVKAETNRLYDDVGRLTADLPAEHTAVRGVYDVLKNEIDTAGKFQKQNLGPTYDRALSQTQALIDDLNNGVGGFDLLKQARSNFNEIVFNPASTNAEKHAYKRLAEALTTDMEATAKKGGDAALEAWKNANSYNARRNNPMDVIGTKAIDKILKNQSDDAIFNLVSTGVKSNASQATKILQQVHLAGGDDALRSVGTSVFERLGNNAAGEFSLPTLTRNWSTLTPEAKDSLFKFKGGSEIKARMDKLVSAGKAFNEYTKSANRSNTANHLTALGEGITNRYGGPLAAVTSISTGSPTALGAFGAVKGAQYLYNRATRKMLDNPQTLSWLAKLPTVKDPEIHLSALQKLMRTTKDERTRFAIREYLDGLNSNTE